MTDEMRLFAGVVSGYPLRYVIHYLRNLSLGKKRLECNTLI